jgi:hypothetical protein
MRCPRRPQHVPERTSAQSGRHVHSEPIRDRAARSGSTCGTDPWIQAEKGSAGRIPAAVRTRQPCAGDPRWARRVANAVLILRVLMLQCRMVTGESLERSGSFLARLVPLDTKWVSPFPPTGEIHEYPRQLTERSPLNREVSKMVPGVVLDLDGSRHHRRNASAYRICR